MIIVGICLMLFGLIGCISGCSDSGDYETVSYHKVYKGSDGWYHGNDVEYLREKPNNVIIGALGFLGVLLGGAMTVVGFGIKPTNNTHPDDANNTHPDDK